MAESSFKLTGMDETLRMLKQLPPELVSKRGGPVRASLRKGAKVLQTHEVQLLKQSLDPEASGLLAENVVVTRGKAPNDGKGERYLVRIKRKTYPRKGTVVTTLQTAQLKEWGSEKQAAEPFIVPTVKAKGREAIEVVTKSLLDSLARIVKKLGGK